MRIVDIRERAVEISRYADPRIPSGGLTTSIVAITTDVVLGGERVVGYGFSSIGRFAQSGLIRERFARRILSRSADALITDDGANLDPFRIWDVMMATEKPGGHGERCVAVGALDMAVWDAAAKIAGVPLYEHLRAAIGVEPASNTVAVYGGGGYVYPNDDTARLIDEMSRMRERGFTRTKMKIGSLPLERDVQRIEAAVSVMGSGSNLSVDAMNSYAYEAAMSAGRALESLGLWWFEDICDPHDFGTQSAVAAEYRPPIAAGEALFSAAEARLLAAHGGLRPDRDVLLFDPAHCYGVPGYLRIVEAMTSSGWPASAFWPHGGHLYSLHLAAALHLGGSELNPFSFQPFGGVADDMAVTAGTVKLPVDRPGIGFEAKQALRELFETLDAASIIRDS
jgi:L-alanine-DL-glutamate epimerase-like enolase superfamily enzyme